MREPNGLEDVCGLPFIVNSTYKPDTRIISECENGLRQLWMASIPRCFPETQALILFGEMEHHLKPKLFLYTTFTIVSKIEGGSVVERSPSMRQTKV